MLNISDNSVRGEVVESQFESLNFFQNRKVGLNATRVLLIFFGIFLILNFMPWTQNVQSPAVVTSLLPEQRPQTLQSSITGKILSWNVKEGDFVQKGDTLIYLTEIKPEYLSPELVNQTNLQLEAKKGAVGSYEEKLLALESNIQNLESQKENALFQNSNEIQQATYKLQSDSSYAEAMKINLSIAQDQFSRYEELFADGLISKTDYEKRKNSLQKSKNDYLEAQNKYSISANDLMNYQLKRNQKINEFNEKIAKAKSDLFSAQSSVFEGQESIAKLSLQKSNYEMRQSQYFITAPQDGYINKIKKSGIGEIIKEGEELLSITPADYELAVESYVRPIDLPLLEVGQEVRIQFDGWPAIVFSGWPTASHGTFGGKIVAIDNFTSENGMYRILIAEEEGELSWPSALRPGAGANTMILLDDVPVWYEIWRKLNGFPPDYTKNLQDSGIKKVADK